MLSLCIIPGSHFIAVQLGDPCIPLSKSGFEPVTLRLPMPCARTNWTIWSLLMAQQWGLQQSRPTLHVIYSYFKLPFHTVLKQCRILAPTVLQSVLSLPNILFQANVILMFVYMYSLTFSCLKLNTIVQYKMTVFVQMKKCENHSSSMHSRLGRK